MPFTQLPRHNTVADRAAHFNPGTGMLPVAKPRDFSFKRR